MTNIYFLQATSKHSYSVCRFEVDMQQSPMPLKRVLPATHEQARLIQQFFVPQ